MRVGVPGPGRAGAFHAAVLSEQARRERRPVRLMEVTT